MTHQFDLKVAEQYGLEAAILINNFQFWLSKNKAAKRNLHDGNVWTYMTISGFSELFPYLKEKTIRRVLGELIEANIIVTGNYNANSYDRTLWYAFHPDSVFYKEIAIFPKQQMEVTETENGSSVKGKSHISKDTKPSIETRKQSFYEDLKPFVETYGKEMLRAFYDYWTQPNHQKTKMGFELTKTWDLEARLRTWKARQKEEKGFGQKEENAESAKLKKPEQKDYSKVS